MCKGERYNENRFWKWIWCGDVKKGYEYYSKKCVNGINIYQNCVSADVYGNYKYHVNIKVDNGLLFDSTCNCSSYNKTKKCEHIASLLYYYNENIADLERNSLADVINKIDIEELKKGVVKILINDSEIYDKFRVEFSKYFPKLNKSEYYSKVYSIISKFENDDGYIEYENSIDFNSDMQ